MSSQQPLPTKPATAFRVLTIVARPLDEAELPDISDSWALVDGLSRIEAPAFIRFLEPPTVEELRSAVLDGWDVIHFDGHGSATEDGGVLAFETEDGTVDLLPAAEFLDMITRSGRAPRLVILSACESASGPDGGLAGVLRRTVPAVIGTKESVTVLWTMKLVRQLYAALGRGKSIHDAYDYAREALRDLPNYNPASETPSEELPVLLGDDTDAALCGGELRGEPVVEQTRLYGWTERFGKFHGDYVIADEEGRPVNPPGGRKGLLVQVARALLRDEKLVTLTGPGGIGKTALAAKAARNLAWRYPGGVFWVDGRNYLTGTIPLDAVLDEFEHVLGKEFLELSTERKRKKVLAYMNGLKSACLIVLDNADTAGEEATRFLQELPPRSAALLTSRVAPEYGGTMIELKAMSPRESLTFLLAEAGRRKNDPAWYMRTDEDGQPEVALDDAEREHLVDITRLLGGHPLALLLAAARVASDGITRTHAIVQKHPALGKELHQRFDFSYTPLSDDEKRLLHLIAAFPADFDEEVLGAVCTNRNFLDGDEALDGWESGLRELRDKSLVEQLNLGKGYRRFRLHPVMRDYVREKVRSLQFSVGDNQTISGAKMLSSYELRVSAFFASLTLHLYNNRSNTLQARMIPSLVNIERHNLVNMQETLFSQGRWENMLSVTTALDELFNRAGHWKERQRALELAIEAAANVGARDVENALKHNLGTVMQLTGDLDRAKELIEESYQFSREAGRRNEEIASLFHLGTLAHNKQLYDEAERLLNEGLTIARELGDMTFQASFLNTLGIVSRDKGEFDVALKRTEEAFAISINLGDKSVNGDVLHTLGRLAQSAKDYAKAREYYEKALAETIDMGDLPNSGVGLAQLSQLDEEEGKYEDAIARSRQAEVIFRQMRHSASISKIEAQIERQLNLLASEQDEPPSLPSQND